MPASRDHAQLSSTATALDDITTRLAAVAETHRGSADDHIATDLDEVERALRTASRRLAKVLRALEP